MNYLLSHKYKSIGWPLFVIFFSIGIFQFFSNWEPEFLDVNVISLFPSDFNFSSEKGGGNIITLEKNNIADEICAFFMLIGALLLMFSKEKDEDEFVMRIRLNSIMTAVFINALIILFSVVFLYDFMFFYIMTLNLFSVFLIYIIRFEWVLHKKRREVE